MNVKPVRKHRIVKTEVVRQKTDAQFLESLTDTLLKPLPKLTQGVYNEPVSKSRQLKRDKRRHSMKIISYPVNHYNCWITSNYYSTKKTIFQNKLISNLVPDLKRREKIVSSHQLSQQKVKTQRLYTQEVRRSPQKSQPKKNKASLQIKKISNIFMQYSGVEIKPFKPLLKLVKQKQAK